MPATLELATPAPITPHFEEAAHEPSPGWGTLTWDHGRGAQRAVVQVSALSDSGAQVYLDVKLRSGTRAYLTGTEFRCVGTVRRCEGEQGMYRVGIEFAYKPTFID